MAYQHIHGMNIPNLKGMGLAFHNAVELTISGMLPGGAKADKQVFVPTIAAFVCMKCITMTERKKPKDAYDIYFCTKHFKGGPKALAESLAPIRGIPDVEAALRAMFTHGGIQVRNFSHSSSDVRKRDWAMGRPCQGGIAMTCYRPIQSYSNRFQDKAYHNHIITCAFAEGTHGSLSVTR